MTQEALGALVLLTGILALYSSSVAAWTIFVNQEEDSVLSLSTLIIMFWPLVYATAIMIFDRELVGATKNPTDNPFANAFRVVLRIALAALLGVAMSKPFEHKLMDQAIRKNIEEQMVRERAKSTQLTKKEVDRLEGDVVKKKDEVDKYEQQASCENTGEYFPKGVKNQLTSLPPCKPTKGKDGKAIAGRGKSAIIAEENARKAKQDLATTEENYKTENKAYRKMIETPISQEQIKTFQRDLLNREMALHRVVFGDPVLAESDPRDPRGKLNSAAAFFYFALMGVLIALEVFPILIKTFFMRYNEYHAYLAMRREVSIQKAHAYSNWAIDEIAKNPANAALQGEYTDVVQLIAEDSAGQTDQVPPQASAVPS
jgi:hypothetical protein